MTEKDKILQSGLLEQYVLGLLSPKEREHVEYYIQKYPDIQEHVRAMQDIMNDIAREHDIDSPEHLKKHVRSEIEQMEEPNRGLSFTKKKNTSFTYSQITGILLFLILGTTSTIFFVQKQQKQQDLNRLEAECAGVQDRCSKLQASYANLQQEFEYIQHPATQHVHLRGTELAPKASIVAYYNPEAKATYLTVLHLPEPPSDKQYQLWADVNGKMINMGLLDTIQPDLQKVQFAAHAESLNITLEPKGGSIKPTVKLLYANGEI